VYITSLEMTSSTCLQYIEKWRQRIYVGGVFSYVVLLVKCLNTTKKEFSFDIWKDNPCNILYLSNVYEHSIYSIVLC